MMGDAEAQKILALDDSYFEKLVNRMLTGGAASRSQLIARGLLLTQLRLCRRDGVEGQ